MQEIKNTIIIRNFLFLFLTGIILSCSDTTKESTSKEAIKLETREEKIDAIYQKYIYEKSICQKFVEIIATDPDFIRKFESLDYRERNKLSTILSNSKVAKSEVVQYVLKHLVDYFWVDVDFHGGAGFVYVKGSAIFCAQTDKRLRELEALGASEKSWEVREHFLNLELEELSMHGMPWYEGSLVYDFGNLLWEFNNAKRLYTGQIEKQRLKDWADKASLFLKEQTKYAEDGAAGSTKEQQIKEIDRWINLLGEGLD